MDLEKLNNEQKEAVLHTAGPLLIVAGAGTGKTTVITQRIAHLIEQKLAKPEEILAVTFTEKAAAEMEERVDRLLDIGYVDLWISTFHAFCERVLRDNALDIGLAPNFKILDSAGAYLLARQNLEKFDLNYYKALGNPAKFIQALIKHFSLCKDQGISPEDYLRYADQLKTRDDAPEEAEIERIREVANAFSAYQKILLDKGFLDFGDLINYCLLLFKKRPLILKKYQQKFKYILVDEFQDTNWAQYELIKILAGEKKNLSVCADDDQSIYKFRGASFSNIVQFKNDFPEAKQISLVKNYRSSQNILDLSYKFIQANNPDRLEALNKIDKKLVSSGGKGVIEHVHCKNIDQETGEVVKKILELVKAGDCAYSDFAILARANDTLLAFIKALERADISYQFMASRGLYSKPVILDVIAYFKLLDNYHESSAAWRVLNFPFFEIPPEDTARITQYSYKKTKSLFETLQELMLVPRICPKTRETVSFILSLIKKHSQMAQEKGVGEVMVLFLSDSGYLKHLSKQGGQDKFDLLNQFYKKIKAFEEGAMDPSLRNFMYEFNLEIESGEEGKLSFDVEQGPDMVKVMTIHGAKGLEFKHVFLVNMVDKRFPTIERKDPIEIPEALIKDIKPKGDVHLQEERRVCYVAMTRAKRGLYFTSADDCGGQRAKKLSRFLVELGFEGGRDVPARSVHPTRPRLGGGSPIPSPSARKHITPAAYIPKHFSYSQLAAFEKCPLQYKFGFILRVPVRGKAVFSFGKTMHNTLCEFLRAENTEKEIKQENLFGKSGGHPMSPEPGELEKIYENNWIDEWYETKKQKQEYYNLGKRILKDFYSDFLKSRPKVFKIDETQALEMPFNLKIGDNTLFGVIDRVDEIDGGAEIIDYKTGTPKEKLDFESKEQLLIYQIAAEDVLGISPKKLTYYYLENGSKLSFLGTEQDKQKQKEKITEIAKKIKSSQFEPNPGRHCDYCDFKSICDHASG